MLGAPETLENLLEIMALTFGCDQSELSIDTTQENCARWTSLYHMTLIVTLEERFGIVFSMEDSINMTSVEYILGVLNGHRVGLPL